MRSLIVSVGMLICLSGFWAQSADTVGSYFIFPRFVVFDDVSTGIAIFNPTAKAAQVDLSIVWFDGTPVSGSPITVSIPSRGQLTRTAEQLLGAQDYLDASLIISSSNSGLIAYCQTFDLGGTFLDGTEAPASGMSLIYPVVPGSSEGACEIDLLNTNVRPTSVELKLWSLDGDLLGKTSVQIPSGGTYRALATSLFPKETNFARASHATAEAKPVNVFGQAQPVYGTSLFAGFSSVPLPGGYVDVAALNALTLAQTGNVGAIPYFRTGSQYASTLSLANVENAANDVTVTAISNSGTVLGTRRTSLRANGGYRAALPSAFPSLGSGDQEGWLLVQASGRIAGAVIYGRNDSAALTALPVQRAPVGNFVIPQVLQNTANQTEITLVNPLSSTGYADVYVVGADGITAASNQVILPPGSRVSKTLNQLIPELTPQVGGYVFVHPSQAVFAAGTVWKVTGELATVFTPQALSVNFYPLPPKTFAVSGSVMLNNRPATGFRVVLSGPQGKVTFVAADGSYMFTGLAPGRYSLAVDAPGFQFVPAQVNFDLTTASKRQNFEGFLAADAIVLQPASAPVGSPDTTISIFGRDFNSSSQAYVGEIRLKTTLVDPSLLQAAIPQYMLADPARLGIYVITNESGADRRVSQTYGFMVYQDKPALISLKTDGDLLEGRGATNLELTGTGFLPDAKVKINGLSSAIEILTLEDTRIVARVPSRYFEKGGIYPVTVANPYPANAESNIQLLTVYHPAPAVEQIIPGAMPVRLEAGFGPADIEVLGYGFRTGTVVYFNNTPLETKYCDWDPYCLTVHLYAKVPVSLLNKSGYAQILVKNPEPSLGSSEIAFLRVDGLQPSITSAVPGSATMLDMPFKFNMPILVNGTNLGPQTTVRAYKVGESPKDFANPDKVLSSTQLYLTVEMSKAAVGEWKIEVANPPPGGGRTEASFTISDENFIANPFLISLTPEVVAAGGSSFTLTINGTNFKSGAVVQFYSTLLTTTVVSSKQVRAEVPASLIQYPGRMPITVINPDGGGSSNRLFLDIR